MLLSAEVERRETHRPLLAGALLYTIGPAAILLMPMMVGVYVDSMGFSSRESGFLASAEASGMGIASILGIFWVRRLNWRRVAIFGLAITILANILATGIDNFIPLLCCRVFASLGAGTAFAVSVVSLGEQRKPERAYGIGLSVQTAMMILMLALSPSIIERWGIDGLYYMLASLGIIVALPVHWLPRESGKNQPIRPQGITDTASNIGPIMVVLLATLIHFVGAVGFWAYVERIGDAAGHSTSFIATVLAIALGAGMLGAAIAAWLSDRFGFAWPFMVSTVVLVISIGLPVGNVGGLLLAFCVISFDFMWVFANTYQAALVARLDTDGSLVVLVPAAQGIGAMAGPALAAILIRGDDYLPVNILAGTCFLISLVLFLAALPRLKNSSTA